MYAVRIHLESFAAELAVPKLTDDDLAKMREVQRELVQIVDEANPALFAEKDRAFHLALYRPANNKFLLRLIDDLRKASLRFLTVYATVERLGTAVGEHELIIAAAEARDAQRVEALIEQNLERTCNVAAAFLRSRAQGQAN
jgi:DNA-binding GntR family transcriptional regulator